MCYLSLLSFKTGCPIRRAFYRFLKMDHRGGQHPFLSLGEGIHPRAVSPPASVSKSPALSGTPLSSVIGHISEELRQIWSDSFLERRRKIYHATSRGGLCKVHPRPHKRLEIFAEMQSHFWKKKGFLECYGKDLSLTGLESMVNFSWTPPMFFQGPGTVHKKVGEIMV